MSEPECKCKAIASFYLNGDFQYSESFDKIFNIKEGRTRNGRNANGRDFKYDSTIYEIIHQKTKK